MSTSGPICAKVGNSKILRFNATELTCHASVLNLFLEVKEMKKSVLAVIAVTMMLTVALCLLAQPPAGQGQGQAPPGQGQGQAPGGQARGGQGARGGMMGSPMMSMVDAATVNKAVAEIEKQLADLKKAMEGAQTMTMPGGPGASTGGTQKARMGGNMQGAGGGPQMQAMMEQMQKRSQAVQAAAAAIADQVLVLKGTQAQSEQEDAINELESIVNIANQEKAVSTAKLAQSIIDAKQKAFTEKSTKLGIGQRGGMGGMMGGMMGGSNYTPPAGGFKYED
jgi:hypothetical protein